MQRDIQLRSREGDRLHKRHDVLPQEHNNDIGERPSCCQSQASLEGAFLRAEGITRSAQIDRRTSLVLPYEGQTSRFQRRPVDLSMGAPGIEPGTSRV
jgi:hypothetical protein